MRTLAHVLVVVGMLSTSVARADDGSASPATSKKFDLVAESVPSAVAANKKFEFTYVLKLHPASRFNEKASAEVSVTSTPKIPCATVYSYDGPRLRLKASCVGPKGRFAFKIHVKFWYQQAPMLPFVRDSMSTTMAVEIS